MLLHRRSLTLFLWRGSQMLLHWSHRVLLLLPGGLIACLHRRRCVNIAIGRKRMADNQVGRTALVNAGELTPVGAGNLLILQLRSHRGSVLFMASRQLGRSGAHR